MRRLALLSLMLLVAVTAMAQERDTGRNGLTVTGNGTTRVAPDEATVRVGVVSEAPTAQEAQDRASTVAQKLLAKLAELKVPKADVQTSNLMLMPVYSNPRPGESNPTISGYRAQNTFSVRLTDFALIGRVIDAGVASGANNVEGVYFNLRNDRAATQAALKEAVAEARAKATAIAEALGMSLAGVIEVIEGGSRYMPPQPMMMGRAMADGASTPVSPGQVEVSASVTVRYLLQGKGG